MQKVTEVSFLKASCGKLSTPQAFGKSALSMAFLLY
jgi:hypothetical protein